MGADARVGRRPCRILLVGMMGSGKSTVGRLLAESTGWSYVDNDELVRRARGMTPRALLAERGEEALRGAEADALALGLELPPPVIVGVAAGTILDAALRRALAAGGIVVWLRASAGTLAARAAGATHRPFLEGDALGWMTDALAEREPLYAEVADVTLDTDAQAPGAVVASLRRWLAAAGDCDPAASR